MYICFRGKLLICDAVGVIGTFSIGIVIKKKFVK